MKVCQACLDDHVETTVPMLLCRRCATEFYAALLSEARLRRLMCQGPTVQAVEQDIAELARDINRAKQRRPPPYHGPHRHLLYLVDFVPDRWAGFPSNRGAA